VGHLKEVGFAQVTDWKAGEDEQIDGASYQTGIASYKADTIFGKKEVQAKALIRSSRAV